MDAVGALVVGSTRISRESDVQCRVEQVAYTEGRSSQRRAHRDYGRKLLRVVTELKKRLPPGPHPGSVARPRPLAARDLF